MALLRIQSLIHNQNLKLDLISKIKLARLSIELKRQELFKNLFGYKVLKASDLQRASHDYIRAKEGHVWIEGNDWPGSKSPHLYYDDHHLVGKGAQQYSQWLVTQVKARAKSLR